MLMIMKTQVNGRFKINDQVDLTSLSNSYPYLPRKLNSSKLLSNHFTFCRLFVKKSDVFDYFLWYTIAFFILL